MDFLKKFTEGDNNNQGQGQGQQQNQGSSSGNQQEGGSFFDKLAGKVNTVAGGGRESEKDEDYLDKGTYPSLQSARVFEAFGFKLTLMAGVDFVQERFLGAGKQGSLLLVFGVVDRMLMLSQIMRVLLSKRRTSRSLIISGSNTRTGWALICQSRTSQQDLIETLRARTRGCHLFKEIQLLRIMST